MSVFSGFSVGQVLLCLLKITCFAEGVLGTAMSCIAAVPLNTISPLFNGIDLIYIEILYAQFTIGVFVTFFTSMGALVTTHIMEHHFVVSVKGAHITWNILAFVLVVFIVLVLYAATEVKYLAHIELEKTMIGGLRLYLSDIIWNSRFNAIQQELECCGVVDFEDWLEKPWIPLEYFNTSFFKQRRLHGDGRLVEPVLPASCCNPYSPGPCYHDSLQQGRIVQMETIVSTVFTRGCVPAAQERFNLAIDYFIPLSVIICIIQVAQIIIENILYYIREK